MNGSFDCGREPNGACMSLRNRDLHAEIRTSTRSWETSSTSGQKHARAYGPAAGERLAAYATANHRSSGFPLRSAHKPVGGVLRWGA